MKKPKQEKVMKGIYLTKKTADKIQEKADEQGRSFSNVASTIIEIYFEEIDIKKGEGK